MLDRAADLIEERGWTTGNKGWTDTDGPRCLEGAIATAAGLTLLGAEYSPGVQLFSAVALSACPASMVVRDYLGEDAIKSAFTEGASGLWCWNDARGRTATEVIAVLRAAALIERAKENTETRAAVTV